MSSSLLVFIVEEFRKKQGKSQLSANLRYFMETGCKATDSDTLKVRKASLVLLLQLSAELINPFHYS